MTALLTPRQGLAGARAARMLGLGTATPFCSLRQPDLASATQGMCADNQEQAEWIKIVFARSGVRRRGTALGHPDDGDNDDQRIAGIIDRCYQPRRDLSDCGPTTAQRMKWYEQLAPPLLIEAARPALAQSQIAPERITHLVTASCTGFFAPGLDAACIRGLGLSAGVERTHVGFMGCHAAFNALGVARAIVAGDANARVLVGCVEVCTLHLSYGWEPQRIVANALFADGAAAAVLAQSGRNEEPHATDAPGWTLLDRASQLLPDSEDAMAWYIRDHGFEMILSPKIPDLIGAHLAPWIRQWLSRHGLEPADIGSWAIHPGGPKVLHAVADALELPHSILADSQHVLAEHGNMSSPTVLFILDRLARKNAPRPCVALGFGPGLTVEAMLLT